MFDLDDEACVDFGSCVDSLPQFFEIVDGDVRIRPSSDEEEPRAKSARAGNPAPK